MRNPLLPRWLGLTAALIAIDQAVKLSIVARYPIEGMGDRIASFFSLIRVHNHGAAFSLLADAGGWQRWFFTLFALIVSALILWLLSKGEGNKKAQFAFVLILAGALGNAVDRLLYGYVVDFLDFHTPLLAPIFYQGHFPAFNIADACISIGAALMLLSEFFGASKQAK